METNTVGALVVARLLLHNQGAKSQSHTWIFVRTEFVVGLKFQRVSSQLHLTVKGQTAREICFAQGHVFIVYMRL